MTQDGLLDELGLRLREDLRRDKTLTLLSLFSEEEGAGQVASQAKGMMRPKAHLVKRWLSLNQAWALLPLTPAGIPTAG